MQLISRVSGLAVVATATLALFASGCTQGEREKTEQAVTEAKTVKGGDESSKHEGWWCDEHGIPEAECSMCSKKIADAFKAKGDWCEQHNRAKSQCFICDPKLKEVFAARYRAKYGKEPPPIANE